MRFAERVGAVLLVLLLSSLGCSDDNVTFPDTEGGTEVVAGMAAPETSVDTRPDAGPDLSIDRGAPDADAGPSDGPPADVPGEPGIDVCGSCVDIVTRDDGETGSPPDVVG